jgi:uncharacterized membrane protein YeaQ/YmgE (transglycosylase-associated protein family)
MNGTLRQRRSPREAVAAAGALPWLLCHTLLYAVLLVAGSIAAQLAGDTFRTAGDNVVLGLVGALIVSYLLVPATVALLALLRLGKELRWYWFRLLALVLLNLPDLLLLDSGAPWVFPAVHSALALLLVQPRWRLDD